MQYSWRSTTCPLHRSRRLADMNVTVTIMSGRVARLHIRLLGTS